MPNLQTNRARGQVFLVGLLLIAGTLVCYWQAPYFDYVNLDDQLYVYENKMVKAGLTWEGFKWAFQTMLGGNWNPMVWLSHMLDCGLYGLPAGGHHLTNVLLHIANALLLFGVLRSMTGTLWRSALAAALFAWHPLHVESVAWISERKDVLSTLFWLLTMWAYVRYAQTASETNAKRRVYYGLAIAFFIFGLMSKAMLVTLPLMLLLVDWWPLGRIRDLTELKDQGRGAASPTGRISLSRAVIEKVPFLLLSVVASVLAVWAQRSQGAMQSEPLLLRLENSAISYATYLGQFLWPVKLAAYYPLPDQIAVWRAACMVMILAGLSLAVFWQSKRRYLTVGWLWFLLTLLPVIGLLQIGMQARADRYTYVPYIGLGIIASWGLEDLAKPWPHLRGLAVGLSSAGLAACIALTLSQANYWRNNFTLYEHALAVAPGNYLAHYDLGDALVLQGKLDQAIEQYQESLLIMPKLWRSYDQLGRVYTMQGKMPEAANMFSNAVRLNPKMARAHLNLGIAWLKLGKTDSALEEMKVAVAMGPRDIEANRQLGGALLRVGKPAEALPYCQMVARNDPRDGHARFALGQAYLAQKQFPDAAENFREAVRLAPDVPQALNALAWVYATSPEKTLRNGPEAVRLAEKACAITKHQDAQDLDTLGAAYAETGQFESALKAAKEAGKLAQDRHDAKLADIERARMELYRLGKPYRDE